jgi:hypothetical protein
MVIRVGFDRRLILAVFPDQRTFAVHRHVSKVPIPEVTPSLDDKVRAAKQCCRKFNAECFYGL